MYIYIYIRYIPSGESEEKGKKSLIVKYSGKRGGSIESKNAHYQAVYVRAAALTADMEVEFIRV